MLRDHFLVTNQSGDTIVFRVDPDRFELSHVNELDEPSNSTPAIANGRVLIRTAEALYCFEDL